VSAGAAQRRAQVAGALLRQPDAHSTAMNKLHDESNASRLRRQRWVDALRSSAQAHFDAARHALQWKEARGSRLMNLSSIALPHRWVVNSEHNALLDGLFTS
jgi:hypothetical protein